MNLAFATRALGALATAAVLAVLSASAAEAGANCTSEAKDKWMSEQAMKDKIVAAGYKIKKFKVSGNCYEIYGWNKQGNKTEVYFNPVNGVPVKVVD